MYKEWLYKFQKKERKSLRRINNSFLQAHSPRRQYITKDEYHTEETVKLIFVTMKSGFYIQL